MKVNLIVANRGAGEVAIKNETFEIKGLAPGDYTLEAWHPTLGTKTMQVKIGTGPKAAITARFSYKRSEM